MSLVFAVSSAFGSDASAIYDVNVVHWVWRTRKKYDSEGVFETDDMIGEVVAAGCVL